MLRTLCVIVAGVILLAGCMPERHEWNQKLTVVVDTPAGEVSGSAVVQVKAVFWGQLPATGTEVEYDIRGEATVVEVAPGRYLFVLLGGSQERFKAFAGDRFAGMTRQQWLREIPRQTEPVSIPPQDSPMMVTFEDINDPASLVEVEPTNLPEYFGEGYRILELSIEITDEPLEFGRLEEVLSLTFFQTWGALMQDAIEDGTIGTLFQRLVGRLSRSDFLRNQA